MVPTSLTAAASAYSRPMKVPRIALRLVSLVAFSLAWELAARWLDSLLLPGFVETLAALARLLATPVLWQSLWLSNQALLLGFGLAAVLGVPLGLLMGRWRAAEQYLSPYLDILLATPKSALIPLFIMATGLGLLSRVLIVFSFALVVIVVNTRAGMRLIDPAWVEMAQSFCAREGQLWRKVFLHGALPAIVTGLRLGLVRAVSGMVSVELLLVAVGIGRLILDFEGMFDAASLYATVLLIVAEALLLVQASIWLEGKLVPWAREAGL